MLKHSTTKYNLKGKGFQIFRFLAKHWIFAKVPFLSNKNVGFKMILSDYAYIQRH